MPGSNKRRIGIRNSTHRTKHHQTQRHRRGNSNRRQTRKNRTRTRTTTPFDLESELRNRERRKIMQNLSTNPFGRTADLRYGINTANMSGEEISKLASRLEEKRERRRRKGKDPFTQQERDLREKTRNNFLEEIMKLRPPMWNPEAWRSEAEISTNPGLSSPTRKELLKKIDIDLEPITELTITEVPLSLKDASLFSRRKSRNAQGNTKRKRKRKKKKHATQKRKRKRKRKRKKR